MFVRGREYVGNYDTTALLRGFMWNIRALGHSQKTCFRLSVYTPSEEALSPETGMKTPFISWLESIHPAVTVRILPAFRANVFDDESGRSSTKIEATDRSFFSLSLSKVDLLEYHLGQFPVLKSAIWVDIDTMVVLDLAEVYATYTNFVLCGFPERKPVEDKRRCYGDLFMANQKFVDKMRAAERRFGRTQYDLQGYFSFLRNGHDSKNGSVVLKEPPEEWIRDLKQETVGRYCWGFDSVVGNGHPTEENPMRLAVTGGTLGTGGGTPSSGHDPHQQGVVAWETVKDSLLQCSGGRGHSSNLPSVAAISFTHKTFQSYATTGGPWSVFVGEEVFRWWQGFVGCRVEDFRLRLFEEDGGSNRGRGCTEEEVSSYLKETKDDRGGPRAADFSRDRRPLWLLIDPELPSNIGQLHKVADLAKFEAVPFVPAAGPGSKPGDRGWDNEAYDAVHKYFWGVENGLVFEAGALDGQQFSVSADFLPLQWHRVLVEGSPGHWEKAVNLWGGSNTSTTVARRSEDSTTYVGACVCDVNNNTSSNAAGVVHYLQKFGGSTGAINGIFEFMSESFVKTFFPWVYKEATRGNSNGQFNKNSVNWTRLGVSTMDEESTFQKTAAVDGAGGTKGYASSTTEQDRKRGYKVSAVPCLTLAHIFEVLNRRLSLSSQHNRQKNSEVVDHRLHINLCILDLEGGEMSALRSIDFSRVYFDVLIVETDAQFRPQNYGRGITTFLAEKGYVKVEQKGRNDWFRRSDFVGYSKE